MIWIFQLLWLVSSVAVGYPIARLALRDESRRLVLLFYALPSGFCAQAILLVLLWSFVPLGTAFYLVVGLSLAVSGLLWSRWLFQAHSMAHLWGLGRTHSVLVLGLTAVSVFLGDRVFTVGYSSWDAEALYLHSGIVSWLGRDTYPPTNPLEPDDPLRYRYGIHVVAAAISSASGALPPDALATTTGVFLGMMVLAFVGASLRAFANPLPGIVASSLAMFGGSLLPPLRLTQVALFGMPIQGQERELINGLLLTGNTLDLVHKNVSVAAGFASLVIALWFCWEAVGRKRASLAAYLVATVALAYLGLVNEVHFVALATAVAGVAILQSAITITGPRSTRLYHLARSVGIVAVAAAFALFRGGFLGGMAFSQSSADSVQLILNLRHFGEVVSPPATPGPQWIPLLSPAAQLDTGFMLVGIPMLLAVAWLATDSYAGIGLTAAGVATILWVSVYPRDSPWDAYRFGQAGATVFLAMVPFALGSVRPLGRLKYHRALNLILGCLLTVVMIPHLMLAASVTISPPPRQWAEPGSPDYLAAEYLRQSPHTWRILVPLDRTDDDWSRLYRTEGPPVAMRVLLGLSGHAIPMGFVHYFNPQAYLPSYREASDSFDRKSLARLGIDRVYVLPSYLSADQRRNLQKAVDAKQLELEVRFGEAGQGSERLLYRVVTNSR